MFSRFGFVSFSFACRCHHVAGCAADSRRRHRQQSPAPAASATPPQQSLALNSLQLLGANVEGSTHAARSATADALAGLRQWADADETFKDTCLKPGMAPLDSVNCMRADPPTPTRRSCRRSSASTPPARTSPTCRRSSRTPIRRRRPATTRPPGCASTPSSSRRCRCRAATTRSSPPTSSPASSAGSPRACPSSTTVLPEAPPPAELRRELDPRARRHVARMKNEGWGAVNRDRGMSMFGCDGAADTLVVPLDASRCRATRTSRRAGRPTAARCASCATSASTPPSGRAARRDGRFVAAGGVKIIDLQKNLEIPVEASYDPGFFPDDSGFLFQGTAVGAGICNFSLLNALAGADHLHASRSARAARSASTSTSAPRSAAATTSSSPASSTSDNGGHGATLHDPAATFGDDATTKFTPMVFDGTKYTVGTRASRCRRRSRVTPRSRRRRCSPPAASPGPDARQIGYVAAPGRRHQGRRRLHRRGAGSRRASASAARKANFSFDERFLVTHHYVDEERRSPSSASPRPTTPASRRTSPRARPTSCSSTCSRTRRPS